MKNRRRQKTYRDISRYLFLSFEIDSCKEGKTLFGEGQIYSMNIIDIKRRWLSLVASPKQ